MVDYVEEFQLEQVKDDIRWNDSEIEDLKTEIARIQKHNRQMYEVVKMLSEMTDWIYVRGNVKIKETLEEIKENLETE